MTNIEKVARDALDRIANRDPWTDPDSPERIAKDALSSIAAMQPAPQDPVAWHTPLGSLIEARQIARQAYKYISREKEINGHVPGNPYDVALAGLNSVLACLAELVTTPLYAGPTPPAGGSDAE